MAEKVETKFKRKQWVQVTKAGDLFEGSDGKVQRIMIRKNTVWYWVRFYSLGAGAYTCDDIAPTDTRTATL